MEFRLARLVTQQCPLPIDPAGLAPFGDHGRLSSTTEAGTEAATVRLLVLSITVLAVTNCDPAFFGSVRLGSHGAIEWGASIDVCPDAMYLRLTGRSAEEVFPGLRSAHADA